MSIISSGQDGWVICHSTFLRSHYKDLFSGCCRCGKYKIFHINSQFMRKGQKTFKKSRTSCSEEVELLKTKLFRLTQATDYFANVCGTDNRIAFEHADVVLRASSSDWRGTGANSNMTPTTSSLLGELYTFPAASAFYGCDITQMPDELIRQTFDVILLDPPWSNKHVKRMRRKQPHKGYICYENNKQMEECLLKVPIESLLSYETGLVAVWCTNSESQRRFLVDSAFAKWKIQYVCSWYWIKVTTLGQPICEFSSSSDGKQPFERIIFGVHKSREQRFRNPEPDKVIVSVPSSLNSHKPPLVELLSSYMVENGRCLEIFARYLIPGWISCGNEVLKLQHHSLFV